MGLSSEQQDGLVADTASMLAHFSATFCSAGGTLLQELARVPMAASKNVVRHCWHQPGCNARGCTACVSPSYVDAVLCFIGRGDLAEWLIS